MFIRVSLARLPALRQPHNEQKARCIVSPMENDAPYWLPTTRKFMAVHPTFQVKCHLIFRILVFAISIVVAPIQIYQLLFAILIVSDFGYLPINFSFPP
jgi:hypothetical protein